MSDISEHDSDSDTEQKKLATSKENDVTPKEQTEENATTSQPQQAETTAGGNIVEELKQQASTTEQSLPEWQQYLQQNTTSGAYTYTDPSDGTVYEWDPEKRGWIPKIDDDFIAHYQANYGFTATGEHDPNVNMDDDDDDDDDDKEEVVPKQTPAPDTTAPAASEKTKKRKQEEPEWFQVDQKTNTNVYVSGLPDSLTEEGFIEFMSKCGIIMEDDKGAKKVKLYKDKNGSFKGDARCCYLKQESVGLACQLLDEYELEGKKVHVEQAVFEMKGNFDPSLKPKKKKKKKKKEGKGQDKLLDWVDRPKKRSKFDRIVILKNMFDYKEFERDPSLITELKGDLRTECEKFGEIKKIMVFDRNPEGVASILFVEPDFADKCIEGLNGRFYAKKVISAETYDGVTNYQVQETEEEEEKRLKEWEKFIGDEEAT